MQRSLPLCRRNAFFLPAALVALALAGCAGLPPERDAPPLRQAQAMHLATSGLPAVPWPGERWWEIFGDAQLNRLIDTAVAGNPGMEVAAARAREARLAEAVALAASGASLNANAMVQRETLTGTGLIPPPYQGKTINEARATIDFSYEIDWWGKHRQVLAAAVSQTRAAEAEAAAARLLVSSAVAQAYFNYQIELQQQKVAREMIKQREALLKLSAARLARGLDPVQPRRQIEADIANARFTIAQIDANVALGRDQLAALLGVGPGDLPAIAPVGPPAVTAGLPENLTIDLVGRRPDVQAQRWRVEAGLRQIDVAKTQFYPNLSVGAFLGLSSIGLGKLLQGNSEVAGVAPALRLPLFDSGRLTANLGAARASLDTAIAQYNQTLVEAVRQVADQAATLAGIADQETALAEAQRTVQRLQALSETRFKAGLTDASAVLVAQTAVLVQADLQAQLAGRRLAAQVALIRVLGGGYTGAQQSGAAGVAR